MKPDVYSPQTTRRIVIAAFVAAALIMAMFVAKSFSSTTEPAAPPDTVADVYTDFLDNPWVSCRAAVQDANPDLAADYKSPRLMDEMDRVCGAKP